MQPLTLSSKSLLLVSNNNKPNSVIHTTQGSIQTVQVSVIWNYY